MEKERYTEPEMDIVAILCNVITESGLGNPDDWGDDNDKGETD